MNKTQDDLVSAKDGSSTDTASRGTQPTCRRGRKAISDMDVSELQALRRRIDMQLHLLVLGDPRKSFAMDATEPERSAGPQDRVESK